MQSARMGLLKNNALKRAVSAKRENRHDFESHAGFRDMGGAVKQRKGSRFLSKTKQHKPHGAGLVYRGASLAARMRTLRSALALL